MIEDRRENFVSIICNISKTEQKLKKSAVVDHLVRFGLSKVRKLQNDIYTLT